MVISEGVFALCLRILCDVIVLPHWGTEPPAPWPTESHYWHWATQVLTYAIEILIVSRGNERQGSLLWDIGFVRHWFDSAGIRAHHLPHEKQPALSLWGQHVICIYTVKFDGPSGSGMNKARRSWLFVVPPVAKAGTNKSSVGAQ